MRPNPHYEKAARFRKRQTKGVFMKQGVMLACIGMLCITGCGNSTGRKINTGTSVNQVMELQTEKSKEEDLQENSETAGNAEENKVSAGESKTGTPVPTVVQRQADPTVDYDLTVMDRDLVYATVAQTMWEPQDYVGKTFLISGIYYTGQNEATGRTLHYCVIKDAMACCAQGMEFVWGDGSRADTEYPAEQTEILVKGTFETYQEENDDTIYCRIANAEMTIKES